MKKRVLVLNNVSETGLKILGDTYEVGSDIVEPEAIILRSAKVDTTLYPNLVAIARAGTGVNNISVQNATKHGVCVFNTPGANANAVAELVFIMLGLHARRVDKALQYMGVISRETQCVDDTEITKKVESDKSKFTGFELVGKTIGVIGLGKIGVLVANGAVARGMNVIGYDAFSTLTNMHQLNPQVEVVRRMEDVFARVDILTVHVPFSEKTKHLIGAKQIELMKEDCILMNYARDGIYDDTAVLNALDVKKVSGYITDFPAITLLQHESVVCTPHLGASTTESGENCAVMAVRQLKNYLDYGVVTNSVNFPVVEMFPSQSIRTRLAIVHKDVPSMISVITGVLGAEGINIQALTNESNGEIGYNLVDLEVDVDENVIEKIRSLPNILRVRVLVYVR